MTLPADRPAAPRILHKEVALSLLAEALANGNPVFLQPTGSCMEPLIRAGDRVEVVLGDTQRGTVALIRDTTGELVCHRVLVASGGSLLSAGDRSGRVREHPLADAIGIVRGIERGSSTLRLDGGWARRVGRLQAAVHLSWLERRSFAVRLVCRLLRRLLVESYRAAWLVSEATSRSSRGGTSPVYGPAASR